MPEPRNARSSLLLYGVLESSDERWIVTWRTCPTARRGGAHPPPRPRRSTRRRSARAREVAQDRVLLSRCTCVNRPSLKTTRRLPVSESPIQDSSVTAKDARRGKVPRCRSRLGCCSTPAARGSRQAVAQIQVLEARHGPRVAQVHPVEQAQAQDAMRATRATCSFGQGGR